MHGYRQIKEAQTRAWMSEFKQRCNTLGCDPEKIVWSVATCMYNDGAGTLKAAKMQHRIQEERGELLKKP